MTNRDLDQAREWAEWADKKLGVAESHANALAAAEVIQSLPNQWVDADKVREALNGCRGMKDPHQVMAHIEKALLTPPLPTLAELIEQGNSLQKYRGMQAKMDSYDEPWTIIGIHGNGNRYAAMATVDHFALNFPVDMVTPLPDLPRLEWPAQAPRNPETPPAETLNNTSSDTPRNPRPEDVSPGEPWLVGIRTGNGIQNDQKFFGIRSSGGTWELFDVDEGWHSRWGIPSDITLISRLVPEVKP